MKKAFYISLAINIALISAYVVKRMYYGNITLTQALTGSEYHYDYNAVRNSIYNIGQVDSNDIVFVGTSLTEHFIVTEIYGNNCKNRGVAGNSITAITNRIAPIIDKHPKKIFLEGGVNDLFNEQPETVFNNYKNLILKIQAGSPCTQLYVQSVLPAFPKKDEIILLNKLLKPYCDSVGVQFIDLYPHFEKNGYLKDSLTYDRLHLNGNGYALWKCQIDNYIN